MAYFDRISELLSLFGSHSFHAAPISMDRCDVICAVDRFCLTFWHASLCLNSISTENWATVDEATSVFIGQVVRSTFLTPRHPPLNCVTPIFRTYFPHQVIRYQSPVMSDFVKESTMRGFPIYTTIRESIDIFPHEDQHRKVASLAVTEDIIGFSSNHN